MRRKAKGVKRDETTEVDDVVKRKRDEQETNRRTAKGYIPFTFWGRAFFAGGHTHYLQGCWNQRKIGPVVEGEGMRLETHIVMMGFGGCETDRLQGQQGVQGVQHNKRFALK